VACCPELSRHVPAKCTHFADKNMLQQIDPDALSYRRNGSISTESALDLKLETTTFERPRALSMPTTFET